MLTKASASSALCALLASAAGAAETTIDWTGPYTGVEASVGDKVTFNYDSNWHNILLHPTNGCAADGAIEVGPLTNDTGASVSHVFTEEEAGTTVTFACDVTQHCEVGQIIHFLVSDAPATDPGKETVIDWTTKWTIRALAGDKVTFNYDATRQNVLIHPTDHCADDGTIEIGPPGADAEASVAHVFTEADAGTSVTFAWDGIKRHCLVGQIVKFIVSDELPSTWTWDNSAGVAARGWAATIAAAAVLATAMI